MCRTLTFKVTSGLDSALRVMTTLRRKQFDVKEFSMKDLDNMSVTLEDTPSVYTSFNNAVLYMEKLEDVYDVQEVC